MQLRRLNLAFTIRRLPRKHIKLINKRKKKQNEKNKQKKKKKNKGTRTDDRLRQNCYESTDISTAPLDKLVICLYDKR